MPRYRFLIVDGIKLEDPAGVELANDVEAATHAARIAREIELTGINKPRKVFAVSEAGDKIHTKPVRTDKGNG
jgi:hypothetical protein